MEKKLIAALLILGLSFPPAYAQRGKAEGRVSLDFHDVEIADIAKSISEITGRNFLLDDRAKGKITIISPTPVSVDEAYQAFLSALEVKNLCAVEIGAMTKIIPLRECRKNKIPVEDSDRTKASGDQPVTRLIPLKYINANEIKTALKELISNTGMIVAYGPTNTLMITDSASNIDRLMLIIQKLDRQNFQATVEVIPLKYAQASDVAEKLNNIFEQKGMSRTRRGSDVEGGADVSKILPDLRTNSIIVTATREGLERTLDLLQELDRPIEYKSAQGRIHFKHLQHADATELSTILTQLISGASTSKKKQDNKAPTSPTSAPQAPGTEPLPWEEDLQPPAPIVSSESNALVRSAGGLFQDDVRVVADPATNSLVVTASPTDYSMLEPVIDQLDQRRRQVFVETLIMEVNLSKGLQVGLAGHGGLKNGSNVAFGSLSSSRGPNPQDKFSSAVASQDPKMLAGLPGMVLGTSATKTFNIGGLALPIQGAMFQALQTNGIVNVLSTPNILTTDNKKAEILVGKDVPFIASTATLTSGAAQTSINRAKIGINLSVQPKINDGDEVTLDVEQKIQDVLTKDKDMADIPTSERSAKTTVVAQNGQTIVIGGLIQDSEKKTTSKVPLLGDIPLLGYLFRDTSVTRDKMNLVIFLTPHIIHDPMDLTRISVKKNNERRKFNKKHGIGENKALYDYDLDSGLNMAAPPPKARSESPSKERRFNYDQPTQDEQNTPSTEESDEVATRRRLPRRETPRTEFASQEESDSISQVSKSRKRRASPASGGNPFADVRPPSSN
jgi:general secretion pathway protein D